MCNFFSLFLFFFFYIIDCDAVRTCVLCTVKYTRGYCLESKLVYVLLNGYGRRKITRVNGAELAYEQMRQKY